MRVVVRQGAILQRAPDPCSRQGMSGRFSFACALVVAVGCGGAPDHLHHEMSRPPFSCHAPAMAEEAPPPAVAGASLLTGESAPFTVERVGEVADPALSTHLRVRAPRARLGEIAVAIGEQIQHTIVVDSVLVDAAVALETQDATADRLLAEVAAMTDAIVTADGESIVIELTERARHRTYDQLLAQLDTMPLETRAIPVPAHRDPHELAAGFCEMIASPRGSATVMGDTIVVHDVRESLDRLDAMIAGLDPPMTAGAMAPPVEAPPEDAPPPEEAPSEESAPSEETPSE